jgi:predicted transcriptional regulator
MSTYRDRTEIMAAILTRAQGGARKTHIQAAAYLSFDGLKKYLAEMTEAGLIVSLGSEYFPTAKGMELLRTLNQASQLMAPMIVA